MGHGRMMLKMAVLMVRHSGGEVTVPRPVGVDVCGQKNRERTSNTGHVVTNQIYSCSEYWMQEMLKSFRTLGGAAGWRFTDGLLWWYVEGWPGGKPFCCEPCPVPEAICSRPSLLWLPERTLLCWAGERGGMHTSTYTNHETPGLGGVTASVHHCTSHFISWHQYKSECVRCNLGKPTTWWKVPQLKVPLLW